jgi:uncharacterized protein YlzI (FlbEa/FlbD family)
MFFVRGLSSRSQEVLINPDQVLYVRPAGLLRKKSAVVLTHGKLLIVDQDTHTVHRRFEEYLNEVGSHGQDLCGRVDADEDRGDQTMQ